MPAWVFTTRAGNNRLLVVEVNVGIISQDIDPILSDARTRVVNDEGVVVLDTENVTAVGHQHVAGGGVQSPAVERALGGESGVTDVPADSSGPGVDVVAGFDPVSGTDWALVSYTAPGALYAVAGQVARNVLILLGTIAFLLAGFAFVVEPPTVQSLDRLSDNARVLRDGDLSRSFESDRRDELDVAPIDAITGGDDEEDTGRETPPARAESMDAGGPDDDEEDAVGAEAGEAAASDEDVPTVGPADVLDTGADVGEVAAPTDDVEGTAGDSGDLAGEDGEEASDASEE